MKLKYLLILIGLCLLVSNVMATSFASVYPPSYDSNHVKATNFLAGYDPFEACDPANSLIGDPSGNSWLTELGIVGYQKFTIAYSEPFAAKRIYLENFHSTGASTDMGINGVMLYGTNTEALFNDVNYSGFESWNLLTNSNFSAHTGDNIPDPAYMTITSNTTPYQYYALRVINNHGNVERVGIRRIELQIFNLTASFYTSDTTIAVGEPGYFYNTSTGALTSILWNFGDGCYSTDNNPSHVYNTTGTFGVNLNVTDGSGYDDTTHLVVVGVPPILNWSATPKFDRYPLNATMIGGNIGNVSANTTYTWTFGDGLYGNTLSPYHVYNTTGTFNVNLSSVNDYGSNFSYEAGYIEAIFLNSSFMVYPSITSQNVNFYDNSTATGSVLNWNWTSTSGWSSTDQNPTNAFTDTNRYNVSLIVRNQSVYNISTISPAVYVEPNIVNLTGSTGDTPKTVNGFIEDQKYFGMNLSILTGDAYAEFDTTITRTGSETLNLTIGASGTAQIDYGSEFELSVRPSKYYQFKTYTKTENATADSIYFEVLEYDSERGYIGVGGTSGKLSGTVDWQEISTSFTSTANTRYIKLRFLNTVVGNKSSAWFDVNGLIVSDISADFHADKTAALIHSDTVSFTDDSDGIPSSWNWGFGDGVNSTLQNPTHIYHTNGSFNVNLNASNGGGTSSGITKVNYITVYDPASSDFTVNSTLGSTPLTVAFTFLGANATNYYWTFGDGNTSTDQNPEHTYAFAGIFNVSCNASNPASFDIEQKTNYITAMSYPVANFSASYSTPLSIVDFTDLSTGSPSTWFWSFGDSCYSYVQNPTHQYNATGNYTVSLNASNAVGYDIETKTDLISIYYPVTNFTVASDYVFIEDPVVFTDLTTETPISWIWSFGDGCYSNTQNPSHIYNASGDYTISLTATNAYGSDTETKPDYVTIYVIIPVANFYSNDVYVLVGDTASFVDSSTGSPTSWIWNFGDSCFSYSQNPDHVYNLSGDYTISLTATNLYGSDSETKLNYMHISDPTSGRTMRLNLIDHIDDANFLTLLGFIGGNESLNSTNDEVDITGILSTSRLPYTDLVGNLFYIFVFGLIFIMIYIRQGSVAIPSVLGLILGGFLLSYMPAQYYLVGIAFVAISVVAILYGIFKER